MYDYILEIRDVLLNLVEKREGFTKAFASYFASNRVNEIVITGSGTSYHAALAASVFLEAVLGIRVRAEYPMFFKDLHGIYDPDTLVIGISQGGQSQSTVDALQEARRMGAKTVVISENVNAEVFHYADIPVLMECGPELSVAKTKGYQATILILMLLGLEGAREKGCATDEEYNGYLERILAVVNNIRVILPAATEWVDRVQSELAESKRIIVLGYKNNYATVLEGALKMLETMRFGIYGYEIEEFFHGIYNAVDQDTYLIYLATEGEYKHKVSKLKSVLQETTQHQFVISAGMNGYEPTRRDCCARFLEDPIFSVLEYIVPLQVVAAKVPYILGIDPFFARDPEFHYKVCSKQRQIR